MNIPDFAVKKAKGEKLSVITCYDFSSALTVAESDIDAILVGDSAAMTMFGYTSTLNATTPMMVDLISAVSRAMQTGPAKSQKLIIGDMPFLSYRQGLSVAVEAAGALMQAGAQSVKLEGAKGNLELITHLVESGIPVMGHLGLTPQSVNTLGGYKVQGRSEAAYEQILKDALALEQSGVFSLVLECVPQALAADITSKLKASTIGIGAGPDCDGQVLVWQDLLGLNTQFKPKFVRSYLDGHALIKDALNRFHADVKGADFPNLHESYQ